jgi:hypothetical protein
MGTGHIARATWDTSDVILLPILHETAYHVALCVFPIAKTNRRLYSVDKGSQMVVSGTDLLFTAGKANVTDVTTIINVFGNLRAKYVYTCKMLRYVELFLSANHSGRVV